MTKQNTCFRLANESHSFMKTCLENFYDLVVCKKKYFFEMKIYFFESLKILIFSIKPKLGLQTYFFSQIKPLIKLI
jgi:hypothetical protein